MINLVLSVLMGTSPAMAGDLFSLPRIVYCSYVFDSEPFYKDAHMFFKAKGAEPDEKFRIKQAEKIADEYVRPALAEGCADKSNTGDIIIKSARNACLSGCQSVVPQWTMLSDAERVDLATICKADCWAGATFLYGIGYGAMMQAAAAAKKR